MLHRLMHVEDKLDRLLALVTSQTERITAMSVELDNLEAQVKANTDAEQAASELLHQLGDMIESMKTEPARLTKLAADLKARGDALAAAILENTPAAPPPPTPPAPPTPPGAAPRKKP